MVVPPSTGIRIGVSHATPRPEGGKNAPFISYRYPSLFEQDPFTASVTQFCFPDMNHFPTDHMDKWVTCFPLHPPRGNFLTLLLFSEAFSFVLTEGDGERRFGYCLRRLPFGKGPRYPIAYSIMTYLYVIPLLTSSLFHGGVPLPPPSLPHCGIDQSSLGGIQSLFALVH